MSQATTMLTAGVIGAVAGGVVAAAVVLSPPFGIRDKAAVSATIMLTQTPAGCRAQTLPASIVVGKKDYLQWTVVGSCTDISPDNVEVQFVGRCGPAKGSTPEDPGIFTEAPPHRGRKIKRNVKNNIDVGPDGICYAYRVVHGETMLEDPELEIMQF
jgi:hypothetical protein